MPDSDAGTDRSGDASTSSGDDLESGVAEPSGSLIRALSSPLPPKGPPPPPPPRASKPPGRISRPAGAPPPIPEVLDGGVVTGASTSPPAPPRSADLPTLAPPRRRKDDESTPSEPLDPDHADVEDLDLEEVLLEVEPEGEGKARTDLPSLSAICMYGRYEVLGRIAFGGMAEIFLGRESTTVGASRYLVIKRILPHVADDSQFVEMFLDEARLAIQLNHPNICHIYEFGELEESFFIAMEWVNGVPLGKLIRKARMFGGVPPEVGVRIVAQIAEALHYAHRAKDALGRPMNIVHRDVSPHNAMVAYDGQVKLLDFGIAKATTHASKTEAGVVKGKFSYMAPEQCLGKDIDARVDVFALGICLYETLTGKALYHRDNEYETMRAVIHDDIPSIRDVNKDLPVELDAIVQKALQKDPADRFQSAGDLQHALERWLAETRQVVNASKVAELMERFYAEQIRRGPLVDSTPFGKSFHQRSSPGKSVAPEQLEPAEEASAPSSSSAGRGGSPLIYAAMALGLLVVGLGAGYALFGGGGAGPVAGASSGVPERPSPVVEEPVVEEPVVEEPVVEEPVVEEPVVEEPVVGGLLLTSVPSGASVRIDGESVPGVTPMTLEELTPGSHEIAVQRAGYQGWTEATEIVAGETAELQARLIPRPTAAPGRLSINTRPWSKVYVGRRLLGTTPIADVSVTSGNVRLRLVDRDGRTHTKTVRVTAGGTERIFYNLSE